MLTRDDNPGTGIRGTTTFAAGERTWDEPYDVVDSLAEVLTARGVAFTRLEDGVRLDASGLVLLPRLVDGVRPTERGTVRTTTTIEVHHPEWFTTAPFEYQHAAGADTAASLRSGFKQWAEGDLVALTDAARIRPTDCTFLTISDPNEPASRDHRVVLGPVQFAGDHREDDEHPAFCPCCLFTNTMDTFREHLASDDTAVLRLFVLRSDEGEVAADCRVNGLDFEAGAEALRAYGATWPGAGFELRKQLVVIQAVADAG